MKTIKILLVIILLTFCETLFSQKEDQKWIFNFFSIDSCDNSQFEEICGASILDFSTIPPKVYREKKLTLDFKTTNASYCDVYGNLLFYSNGQSLHGANHEHVINGDTINYSPKWSWLTLGNEFGEEKPSGMNYCQSTNIFEVPDQDSLFYCLYHNYENNDLEKYELWKSTIKKNENGEFEVFDKDEPVNKNIGVPGNLHGCKHANGRDSWILQFKKDSVFAYLLSPSGLNLNHTQQLPFELRDSNGQSKFSLYGDKFAMHGQVESQTLNGADLMIASFDRCSGMLIDPQYFQISSVDGALSDSGLEFSGDGKLLYLSYAFEILQYDLLDEDILASGIIVSEMENTDCSIESSINSFGQMNFGIDGKIYISMLTQCFQVHRIENPNVRGVDCNVIQNAIILPTYVFGTSPNISRNRLGPLDGSPCDTLGINNNHVSKFWYEQDSTQHHDIQFRDFSYYRPEVWSWTFGDGNTSDEISPLHEYAENGVYEVCLTVSNENSSNTSCQEIQIGPVANQNVVRSYHINIFPNPVEDLTRLVFHDYLPEDAWIVLFDVSGKKVFNTRVYQESMIDITGLNSGIYLYEIFDGIEFLSSGKIIKI